MKKKTIRILAAMIAGAMMFSFAGCGSKKEAPTYGMLTLSEEEIATIKTLPETSSIDVEKRVTSFNSTNDLLTALQTGKIQMACIPEFSAAYFTSKNPDFVYKRSNVEMNFRMEVLKENAELYEVIETALKELMDDGTVDELQKEYISAYFAEGDTKATEKGDPTYNEVVKIDGAPTMKVIVTGDMPPLDYTDADGMPAGFNVALMNKIAEKIEYNIEFVSVTSDAKASALSSEKGDVVFLFRSSGSKELTSDKLLFTTPYYSSYVAVVGKYKSVEDLEKVYPKEILGS